VTAVAGSRFPWGTLVINVVGSFALGLLAGTVTDAGVLAVAGVGVLGGFTTFSSVASASAVFWDDKRTVASVANALGTLVLTIGAASGGLAIGALLV
jgi:CrcB protein